MGKTSFKKWNDDSLKIFYSKRLEIVCIVYYMIYTTDLNTKINVN